MTDDTDIMLEFIREHWEEMRHIENQRATIANIVIIITSFIIGFIVQQKPGLDLLPIPIFLIALGAYGAITTAKLYERHQFAQSRLSHWYKRIDELHPKAKLLQYRDEADVEHNSKFPRISKFHLHRL